MNCLDDFLERGEGVQVPAFKLEFPVVGFLMPILPWRSLGTHGWTYEVLCKEIQHKEAPVFTSLITMEDFRNTFGFSYGIFHSFKNEFLRVPKGNRVSDYFSGIRIQYCCKVKRHAFPCEIRKIRPPYPVRTTGGNLFCEIWDSGIWNSYILIFRPFSRFLYESGYRECFHEPSGLAETPSESPRDTTVSVPRMLGVHTFKFFARYFIFLLHDGFMMK